MPKNLGPRSDVLRAFGVADAVSHPLSGGQGQSFLAGTLVLKRTDNIEEARWSANTLERLVGAPAFRVASPVRSTSGDWVHDGWTAFVRIDGEHAAQGRWLDVLTTCREFHTALRDVPRPSFLDTRRDPWSVGDRAAWEELRVALPRAVARPVEEHLRHLVPLPLSSQMIHGDLGGNVLFASGQPPAVIDFSPYWRPAPFAEAIVIADAIAWNHAPRSLVEWFDDRELATQLLLRACIYRLVTIGVASSSDLPKLDEEVDAYDRVTDAAQGLPNGTSEPILD